LNFVPTPIKKSGSTGKNLLTDDEIGRNEKNEIGVKGQKKVYFCPRR
jgi:hypothetical protein